MSGSQKQQKTKSGGTGMSKDEGSERLQKAKDDLPHGDSGGLHNPKGVDYRKLAGSNRALHKQLGAGKGSDRRPPAVGEAKLAENWCATFGHKWVDYLPSCANGCGTKKGAKK